MNGRCSIQCSPRTMTILWIHPWCSMHSGMIIICISREGLTGTLNPTQNHENRVAMRHCICLLIRCGHALRGCIPPVSTTSFLLSTIQIVLNPGCIHHRDIITLMRFRQILIFTSTSKWGLRKQRPGISSKFGSLKI